LCSSLVKSLTPPIRLRNKRYPMPRGLPLPQGLALSLRQTSLRLAAVSPCRLPRESGLNTSFPPQRVSPPLNAQNSGSRVSYLGTPPFQIHLAVPLLTDLKFHRMLSLCFAPQYRCPPS